MNVVRSILGLVVFLYLCFPFLTSAESLSPKQRKEEAVRRLEAIVTSEAKTQRALTKAIELLKESIAQGGRSLFLTEDSVVSFPLGLKVFDQERKAVEILLDLRASQEIQSLILPMIMLLVEADEELAAVSLRLAELWVRLDQGNAHELEKAQQTFAAAQAETDPRKKIAGFRRAWAFSQRAVDERPFRLLVTAFADQPDPFSPHLVPNVLNATVQLHHKNDAEEDNEDKRRSLFFLEWVETVLNGNNQVVRVLKSRRELPPMVKGQRVVEVSVSTSWDGRNEQGEVVRDGTYQYLALAQLIHQVRQGPPNTPRVRERVQLRSFPVSGEITVDGTPPQLVGRVTPDANSFGWHKEDVTVSWAAEDFGSGVTEVSADTLVTVEGAGQVVEGFARDGAGNVTTAQVVVNLDRTAPQMATSQTPASNLHGWNNVPVAVLFTATDALSGIRTVSPPSTVTSEGIHSVAGSAEDFAGNSASIVLTVRLDQTGPTLTARLSPAPNENGWNNTATTVFFEAVDALSGIDSVTGSVIVQTEGKEQISSGVAVDQAGNISSTAAMVSLDRTIPTLVLTPAHGASLPTSNPELLVQDEDLLAGIHLPSLHITLDGVDFTELFIRSPNEARLQAENLSTGSHTLEAQVADLAGNIAIAQSVFSLIPSATDTTGPTVTLSPADNQVLTTASPLLRVSYSDDRSGVNLSSLVVFLGETDLTAHFVRFAQEAFFAVTSPLPNGTHTWRVLLSDLAGNQTPATATFVVQAGADNIPPTLLLNPGEGKTVNSSFLLVSYADPSAVDVFSLKIFVDGQDTTHQFVRLPEGASTEQISLADEAHHWLVRVSDTLGNTAIAQATFTVSVSGPTLLQGKVTDLQGNPISGVLIALDQATTTTAADGAFSLPTEKGSRTLIVDGRGRGFAYIAELIHIASGLNILPQNIFLPPTPLDEEGTPLSTTTTTVLTNPNVSGVEVRIAPNSVKNADGTPYTGKVLLLQVPRDRTPLSLPSDLRPDLVIAVQPGGLIINPPAQLVMPNLSGHTEGTFLDLWSLNPNTGVFEVKGKMQVSGGRMVQVAGGMGLTAWHFPIPLPAILDLFRAPSSERRGCISFGASGINITTGDLEETHPLPKMRFLNEEFAPQLFYMSKTAQPRTTVESNVLYISGILPPLKQRDQVTVAGIPGKEIVRAPQGQTRMSIGNRISQQIDLREVPSGKFEAEFATTSDYGLSQLVTRRPFSIVHNNQSRSPLGAGWNFNLPTDGGFARLLPQSDGSVVMLDGEGSARLYLLSTTLPSIQCMHGQVWTISGQNVNVYDAQTLSLIKSILIGVPKGLTLDPLARKAYVITFLGSSTQFHEIDGQTFTVRSGFSVNDFQPAFLSSTGTLQAMGVSEFGQLFLVGTKTNVGRGLLVISTDLLRMERFVSQAELGVAIFPSIDTQMKVSQDMRNAWLQVGLEAIQLDLANTTVERRYDFLPNGYGLAVNETRRELYIVSSLVQGGVQVLGTTLNVFNLDTGQLRKEISLLPGFVPIAGFTPVSVGPGSLVYVNLFRLGGTDSVLHGVDVEQGGILPTPLATNVILMDSLAGQTDLFTLTADQKLQRRDGPTGTVLQQTSASLQEVEMLRAPDSILFLSPAGDFSHLSLESQGTEDPSDDVYLRQMPSGTEHTFSRDGLLLTTKDRRGLTFTFAYLDADGNGLAEELSHFTTPVGGEYRFFYAGGKITSIVDPAGRTTSLSVDGQGDLVQITNPDGTTRQFTYTNHLLTSQTNERGFLTTYEYNVFDFVVKSNLPDNTTRSYRAESEFGLVDPTSGLGTEERPFLIDGANKPVSGNSGTVTDGRGNTLHAQSLHPLRETTAIRLGGATFGGGGESIGITHNAHGQVLTISGRGANSFAFIYDQAGNLLSTLADGGTRNLLEYNPQIFNLPTKFSDARGSTVQLVYDNRGNLTKGTDPLGGETHVTRTGQGLVAGVQNALGFTSTFTYTPEGNVASQSNPLGDVESFSYDSAGNLLTYTDALGRTTTFTYDLLNRPTSMRDGLGGLISWSYDQRGNLISVTNAEGATTHLFHDPMDRLTVMEGPLGARESVIYDEAGNIVQTIDAMGRITFMQYDAKNRLTKVIQKVGDSSPIPDSDDAVTQMLYNIGGRNVITETTDPEGRRIFYEYDVVDRLTRIQQMVGAFGGADDAITTFTYDLAGNRASIKDPNGKVTYFKYDLFNNLVKVIEKVTDTADVIDADDVVTSYTVDFLGNRTSVTDPNGKVTYFRYDALGRLVQEMRKVGDTANLIDSDDAVTSFGYDAVGNLTRIEQPNGVVITRTYDELNRLLSENNGAGETTTFAYTPTGQVREIRQPDGQVITFAYDLVGRQTEVRDNFGLVLSVTYDAVGDKLTETDGVGNTIRFTYDRFGRIIQIEDPTGAKSTVVWDKMGNRLSTTNRNHETTTQTFDEINRLKSVRNALNEVTQFQYDPASNLVTLIDANNHATIFTYDDLQRVVTKQYADNTQVRFTYSKADNILTRTDQKGVVTRYEYDDLYFLLKRDYATEADETFTYDKSGRMLSAQKGTWLVQFTYDGADRITETVQNGQSVRYSYDIPARHRTLTYPHGRQIVEELDIRGRLTSVREAGQLTPLAQFTWDLADRLTQRQYANGVSASFTHHGNDWVTRLENRSASNALLAGFSYGYDQEGNRNFVERLHDLTRSEAHTYDQTQRLTQTKVGQAIGQSIPLATSQTSLGYDPVGNITSRNVDGISQTRSYSNVNALTSVGGAVAQVDLNGNLIDDGVQTYNYDEENRLNRVTRKSDGQVLTEYVYDGLWRRVIKRAYLPTFRETRYVYDGEGLLPLAELDSLVTVERSYVWGVDLSGTKEDSGGAGGLVEIKNELSGRSFQPLFDAGGNVVGLTDTSGAVVSTFFYSSFGQIVEATGEVSEAPLRFSTKYFDAEVGLTYYGFRFYHPGLERWLNQDPLSEVASGTNLYAFVQNNPASRVDVDGRFIAPVAAISTIADAAIAKATGNTFNPIRSFAQNALLSCIPGLGQLGFLSKAASSPVLAFAGRNLAEAGIETALNGGDLLENFATSAAGDFIGGAVVKGGGRLFNKFRGGDEAADLCKRSGTPSTGCFVEGTLVLTPEGYVPIDKLRVGDRVITSDESQEATEIEGKDWCQVKLAIEKPDGNYVEIETIHPAAWLEQAGWQVGKQVWFVLAEMGIEGWAKVLALEKCPEIRAGPGRLVLSTFKSRNGYVLEIRCEGVDEPIGVTIGHKLWSEDRGDWIVAGALQIGERLKTKSGMHLVAKIERKPGIQWVYNLEVEGEHCYYAGKEAVLGHNTQCLVTGTRGAPDPLTGDKPNKFRDRTTGKEISFDEAVERMKNINPNLLDKGEDRIYSDVFGLLRESAAAKITGGRVSGKGISHFSKPVTTDIDVRGPGGELISVGGPGKGANIGEFEGQLQALIREAGDPSKVGAIFDIGRSLGSTDKARLKQIRNFRKAIYKAANLIPKENIGGFRLFGR